MSGHSKWSKVKHQKATTDAVKSAAFTRASRAITVSVHEGGGIGDPNKNFRLRLAIEKAREVNMPKLNIERAIEKATADGGATFENILYEGYGPGGVAFLVEAATDNHQRTGANMKHAFEHGGGALAQPGAVSFQFQRCGVLVVEKNGKTYDELLNAALIDDVDDVVERDDMFEVYTSPTGVVLVKDALARGGWVVDNWEIIMKPMNVIHPDSAIVQKNEALLDALEVVDDVQHVFSNLE